MNIEFKTKKLLIIVPHPDDEVLGAGGTIAKLSKDNWQIHALVVSGHLPPLYSSKDFEITQKEFKESARILGINSYNFLKIPATQVDIYSKSKLNNKLYNIIEKFEPSILLIPFPDRHIDHRIIFEASLVASRPIRSGAKIELVASYETLSETHWNAPYLEPNFMPNFNVDISNEIEIKLDALRCYKSQLDEFDSPRSVEAAKSLSRFRGSQCNFKFAESFVCLRLSL